MFCKYYWFFGIKGFFNGIKNSFFFKLDNFAFFLSTIGNPFFPKHILVVLFEKKMKILKKSSFNVH